MENYPWPMLLTPILLEKVWGGDRLASFPSKILEPGKRFGESWDACALPGRDSVIASGPLSGRKLSELCSELDAQLLGPHFAGKPFPLLLKIIDARDRLSLQLHPPEVSGDGRGAGKAEAWYVLQGGDLMLGLAEGADPEKLKSRLRSGGDPTEFVRVLKAKPGDTIAVPPGTIHAIGQGLLVVEIQQPADITYRIHDWGRKGRELHLDEGFRVLDASSGRDPLLPPLERQVGNNTRRFHLGCRHFGLESLEITEAAPWVRATPSVELVTGLRGRLRLGHRDGEPSVVVGPGETALIPATAPPDLWMNPLEPASALVTYPCRLERDIYDRLVSWGFSGQPVAERIFAS